MSAILALICFVLATFGADVADINLLALGLAFLALHFVLGGWPWGSAYPWARRQ